MCYIGQGSETRAGIRQGQQQVITQGLVRVDSRNGPNFTRLSVTDQAHSVDVSKWFPQGLNLRADEQQEMTVVRQ